MKKFNILIILVSITSLLTACAPNISPNSYDVCEAGRASRVVPGTIIGKRKVKIDANSGAGGLAGAAAGAVGGSAIGGGDRAHIAGAIGGAVLGGLIGNQIDKKVNSKLAYEYIVKLVDGETISVAQAQDLEFFMHEPVLIIYGATTRIVPDESVEFHRPRYAEEGREGKRAPGKGRRAAARG